MFKWKKLFFIFEFMGFNSLFRVLILGDGSGSFLLTNGINSGSGSSGRTRTAKYSIALQYLFLEDVTEDDDT